MYFGILQIIDYSGSFDVICYLSDDLLLGKGNMVQDLRGNTYPCICSSDEQGIGLSCECFETFLDYIP